MRLKLCGSILALALALAWATASASAAYAGVSAEEAAKLKTTLTPFGAEKAGNADGSVPAWSGGMTSFPGYTQGGRHTSLFTGDKPLFSITAANMAQYADKLTEGAKAMFAKFPDYRMDVYKTERTSAAPQWVYDNTFINATRGTISDLGGESGWVPDNVYGGIPYPIPKQGAEAMWNTQLNWHGVSIMQDVHNYLVTAEGKRVPITVDSNLKFQFPYYFEGGSPETFKSQYDNVYWAVSSINDGPPIRAGEGIAVHFRLDPNASQAWVYLTGQRRVRQLPNACCDTPTPSFAGVITFDEINVFSGSMARFDWNLVGKTEKYVQYNDNAGNNAPEDQYIGKQFLNPDHQRWELHRVWVVEATLRSGKRHVAPKTTYYIDEDSWWLTSADRYDSNGQLWKFMYNALMIYPEVPTLYGSVFGYNDVISGTWAITGLSSGRRFEYQSFSKPWPMADFDPQALAAEGVR